MYIPRALRHSTARVKTQTFLYTSLYFIIVGFFQFKYIKGYIEEQFKITK